MPKATIGFGIVLIAIGLWGYFGSAQENPSKTALIPAALGAVLAACGAVAHKPALRPHAMHLAVLIGLVGLIAGIARLVGKFRNVLSDDLSIGRPARMSLLLAIVCLVFVILCVRSFIAARRARTAGGGSPK